MARERLAAVEEHNVEGARCPDGGGVVLRVRPSTEPLAKLPPGVQGNTQRSHHHFLLLVSQRTSLLPSSARCYSA